MEYITWRAWDHTELRTPREMVQNNVEVMVRLERILLLGVLLRRRDLGADGLWRGGTDTALDWLNADHITVTARPQHVHSTRPQHGHNTVADQHAMRLWSL